MYNNEYFLLKLLSNLFHHRSRIPNFDDIVNLTPRKNDIQCKDGPNLVHLIVRYSQREINPITSRHTRIMSRTLKHTIVVGLDLRQ